MNQKPEKRIALVDDGKGSEVLKALLPFIADRYDLEITEERDADYIFHSHSGYDVLRYPGVRIFFTGECVSPNFNISDYALAFDPIEFGDRYCRLPLIKLLSSYPHLQTPRLPSNEVLSKKTGSCAYVMSNTKNSASEREQLVDALNTYKPVAMGGKWRNNVGGPVADKIQFQSAYKFVLAIENYSAPGYLTEKFADAAASNAIPIYWGDPSITKYLNPKAFINCHDFNSLEQLVAYIREIDQNNDAYRTILSEPWFPNNLEPQEWQDATFTNFLCHIFDQPHHQAYRRNRGRWGIKTEKRLYDMALRPWLHSCKRIKAKLRS